jgi:16S rRNA (adenine1518-N6/adenine1519-N6)-dimethyltransferase
VKSGEIRMRRKEDYSLPCSERIILYGGVKLLFSNAGKHCVMFKTLNLSDGERSCFNLRPNNSSKFIALQK